MPKCHFGNGDNDSDNNDNDEIDNIDVWRTPNNNIRLCLKLVYEFDSCIHISPIHTDTHTLTHKIIIFIDVECILRIEHSTDHR